MERCQLVTNKGRLRARVEAGTGGLLPSLTAESAPYARGCGRGGTRWNERDPVGSVRAWRRGAGPGPRCAPTRRLRARVEAGLGDVRLGVLG